MDETNHEKGERGVATLNVSIYPLMFSLLKILMPAGQSTLTPLSSSCDDLVRPSTSGGSIPLPVQAYFHIAYEEKDAIRSMIQLRRLYTVHQGDRLEHTMDLTSLSAENSFPRVK